MESDEPAVFQDESAPLKPKILEAQKVEEQPAILMEQDKPDFIPLFFDPERNGVIYAHQEIEYDLTNPLILRIGPLAVTAAGVVMRMSRETGQFFEFEFGLDLRKRYANMYMLSFQWPVELIPEGQIELLNDEGKVLWLTPVVEEKVEEWKKFVALSEPSAAGEVKNGKPDKPSALSGPGSRARPVSRVGAESLKRMGHDQSSFGLFGGDIFDIPVWKITEPFRFCVTKDSAEGRIALCSKRYRFIRKGGLYSVIAENKTVVAKVMVNDKDVTLKGSAVFIDDKKPIKFSALMGNGTYFEFVSFPKRITIVDMVLNEKSHEIEVIGYGPPPLGPIQRINRIASDYWDFLNFMPTIGDFRQFWKAKFPAEGGSIYLRGYGGAPFRQPIVFERLPRKSTRPLISIKSPKSTYAQTVKLIGETTSPVSVDSKEDSAKSLTDTLFEWDYLARSRGEMNKAEILVKDGKYTYRAFHEIYKGYPRELSLRSSGVLTNELAVLVLGELAGQWWFEKILGWDNRTWSHQRWGINVKMFQSVAAVGGKRDEDHQPPRLQVGTFDLKYRLTPGIWARDHTLGLIAQGQWVKFGLDQCNCLGMMGGVGAFWARSMPKVFDEVFNVLPFMRYPKWVDVEGIVFLMPLSSRTQLGFNSAVNFHGKILWSERFFGEAGFGLKVFQFSDLEEGKNVGLGVLYGTAGLGLNF